MHPNNCDFLKYNRFGRKIQENLHNPATFLYRNQGKTQKNTEQNTEKTQRSEKLKQFPFCR